MKIFSVSSLLIFCSTYLFLLSSCNKNIPCLPPRLEITGTQTIFEGETLNLTAESDGGATFLWTGPNNFTSTSATINIQNATVAASGEYTVKASVGECEITISKTVDVMPGPTCSPATNTINFINNMTFTNVYWKINSSNWYEMSGSSSQGDFNLYFYNNPLLSSSAVYELSTMNSTSGNAFMQINVAYAIYSNWQARSGKLYLTVQNRKVIATFCGAVFGNIQGATARMGSGKIIANY